MVKLPTPRITFLCLGLLYGGALVVVTPPFLAPDELAHFYRAYQISEGVLIGEKRGELTGGYLPTGLKTTAKKFLKVRRQPNRKIALPAAFEAFSTPLDRSDRRFVSFESTSLWSPLPYLPQALGIAIGTALDLGPLPLLYLGRGANLAVSLLVIAVALQITPVFRWVMLLLALMPMAVFQMASVSSDAFANSIAFLFVALILRLGLGDGPVERRDVAAFLLVSLLLSLSKSYLFPLLLLYFTIPVGRFGSVRRYVSVFGLGLGLSIAALGGWTSLVAHLWAPPSWIDNVDPAAQLELIWARPNRFVRLLFGEPLERVSFYADQLVGSSLGSLDAPLPQLFIRTYQVVLVATALCDARSAHNVAARFKLIGVLLVFAEYVLISTLSYVFALPVGAPAISSLQGRYFIPLSPLLLLPLYNQRVSALLKRASHPEVPPRAVAVPGLGAFLILSAVVTCWSLVARYYVWA